MVGHSSLEEEPTIGSERFRQLKTFPQLAQSNLSVDL